ncbi:MAG: endonuclease/exonuclease/phosphatase family protein [bacterium]
MKKHLSFLFILVATLLLFAGCDNTLGGFAFEEKQISFETFNARLGDDYPLAKERTDKLERVLKFADSDILCLQEIYKKEDIEKISRFLKDPENGLGYISTVYVNTKNEDFSPIPPSCSMEDVLPVGLCIAKCGGDDLSCIAQNCLSEILGLPAECRNCLIGEGIGSIAGGNYEEILEQCVKEKKVVYKNEGNNGVLLASKYPLKDKGTLALTSHGIFRMAVYATLGKIEKGEEAHEYKPAIGDTQIICTALSKISDERYDGTAGSWQREQLRQIEEILEIPVKEDVTQRVIMGDFNSNISGGENILASNPSPVETLLSAGWYDPYFDVKQDSEIECTVCPENPLNDAEMNEAVHDHIFFKQKKGFIFSSKRVFENEFTLVNEKKKTKTTYSVSNHYGLQTVMTVDPNY